MINSLEIIKKRFFSLTPQVRSKLFHFNVLAFKIKQFSNDKHLKLDSLTIETKYDNLKIVIPARKTGSIWVLSFLKSFKLESRETKIDTDI